MEYRIGKRSEIGTIISNIGITFLFIVPAYPTAITVEVFDEKSTTNLDVRTLIAQRFLTA